MTWTGNLLDKDMLLLIEIMLIVDSEVLLNVAGLAILCSAQVLLGK